MEQNPPTGATISTNSPAPSLTATQPSSIAPTVLTTTVIPGKGIGFFGGVKRLCGFVIWVLTGFGLIGAFRRKVSAQSNSEEIILHTVHCSFYLWGMILIGFVGSFCVNHFHHDIVWGWIYVFVFLYTIAAMMFDVSTGKALLWGGAFALLWVSSKYLEAVKGMVVLSAVRDYLRNLRPKLDPGMASVISWMLLVPWIGSLFHSFTRGRKAFSPNSIEEWFMGEGREILDRSGLKFRTVYRDLFESILGLGAGDIEAIDNSQHVVKRWENVLFLAFVWPRLDAILHQRAATVDNVASEPVEVEQVNKR